MSEQQSYRRVVIKLGTNVITTDDGQLDHTVIEQIVDQIAVLKKRGVEVILVTSGAVGAGKAVFKVKETADKIVRRQLYSSIGQVQLMNTYMQTFAKYDLVCAQVLTTREDFDGMEHYKNMKNCFHGLLTDSVIPIVNENDVVSLTELMFTDNDELAGLTAFMIEADSLFILTTVEGVYRGDPKKSKDVIKDVPAGSQKFDKFIESVKSSGGRGGMESKFAVANRAATKGMRAFIANGKRPNVVLDIIEGEKLGTAFVPDKN